MNLSIATRNSTGRSSGPSGSEEGSRIERESAEREEQLFAAIARLMRPTERPMVACEHNGQEGGSRQDAPSARRIAEVAASVGGALALFAPNLAQRLVRAGIGAAESERISAVLDAALAVAAWWPSTRVRVQSPGDLAAIALPIAGRAAQEELHVAIVDGRNGLLALRRVYLGTATGTSVRIGELLRPVLDYGGVGFALVHNHPSGDPEPSDEDVRLTAEVLAAARLLDIEFLDHLVLGHGRWASIRTQRGSIWGSEGDSTKG